jgi:hypothetical protein
VEPSEHHKQSDKDDGADQDPGGSRVHASLLSIDAGCSLVGRFDPGDNRQESRATILSLCLLDQNQLLLR